MTVRTRNGRTYAYRSVRSGGRVTSRYVASGARAERIARQEVQGRALRCLERAERAAQDAIDRILAELCDHAASLARAALAAAGYHLHHRQWRKRRMPPLPQTPPQEEYVLEVVHGHRAIDALAEARLVEQALPGSDATTKRHFRRELIEHAAELAGPDPSPIETALARTAAICWLSLRVAEARTADFQSRGGDPIDGELRQRGIDRAHRRYVASLRSLALVRKLAQPSVRVAVIPRPDDAPAALPRSLYDRLAGATSNGTNGHANGTH
jgi:hypothetical protein